MEVLKTTTDNKQVQVFNNGVFGDVRVVVRDGEPWFVGKDVASALGFQVSQKALHDHVDNEDKEVLQKFQNRTFDIPNRGLTIINESGLYSLILSSKLPSAKAFKRWVTAEVLPTIRKQGMYLTPATSKEAISDPDTFLAKAILVANQVLEQQKNHIKHLETTNNALTTTISTANITTLVRKRSNITRNDMTIRDVSILLGERQNKVYRLLQEAGWFMRAEEGTIKNVPTLAAPPDCFYIEESSYNHKVVHQVRVTKQGLLKIKSLL